MECPTLSDLPPPVREGWPWTVESQRAEGVGLPRISIVVPSLDQAMFLEAAVRSALLQGYPDLELIVVDGGSVDESVDVLRRYEPWIAFWTSEPDDGQFDAINKGFERSTGDVMGWLNSSDMLAPHALATVGAIFAELREAVEWLTGLPALWDEEGRALDRATTTSGITSMAHRSGLVPAPRYLRDWIEAGYYEGRLLGWIQQESTFWSRELWQRAGGHLDSSLLYAADFELWRRFAAHAPLRVVETQLGGFRLHGGQKISVGLDGYYAEIDERRGPVDAVWARLARRSRPVQALGRLAVSVWARLRPGDGAVARDRATGRWVISH